MYRYCLVMMLLFSACTMKSVHEEAELADHAIAQIVSGNSDSLLQAFHYPETETAAERHADREGVRDLLRILLEDFGSVESRGRVDANPAAYIAFAGAGTVGYWSQHPAFHRYTYDVSFAKRGRGWVFVDVVAIGPKPEVRWVGFALPIDRAGARESVQSTMDRFAKSVAR